MLENLAFLTPRLITSKRGGAELPDLDEGTDREVVTEGRKILVEKWDVLLADPVGR